jgi:hypothetical protein
MIRRGVQDGSLTHALYNGLILEGSQAQEPRTDKKCVSKGVSYLDVAAAVGRVRGTDETDH